MTTISWIMFAHPVLTMHVLCMVMHLSSSHVTVLLGEFQPPNSPQSNLQRQVDSRWALNKFLVSSYVHQ